LNKAMPHKPTMNTYLVRPLTVLRLFVEQYMLSSPARHATGMTRQSPSQPALWERQKKSRRSGIFPEVERFTYG
jgi:hypothetical protein